mmetsp:Transcript_5730/g.12483  ORF Transcript_5730/g.12483 Transcript_5730/m.12483 type:complete len:202 (+) Transcript_5730:683-1288(+)
MTAERPPPLFTTSEVFSQRRAISFYGIDLLHLRIQISFGPEVFVACHGWIGFADVSTLFLLLDLPHLVLKFSFEVFWVSAGFKYLYFFEVFSGGFQFHLLAFWNLATMVLLQLENLEITIVVEIHFACPGKCIRDFSLDFLYGIFLLFQYTFYLFDLGLYLVHLFLATFLALNNIFKLGIDLVHVVQYFLVPCGDFDELLL